MHYIVKSFLIGLTLSLLGTVLSFGQGTSDPVQIPTEYISVGDYSGTANQRIAAAIAAAMATDHKTVFFPNGTYALRNGLSLNQGSNTELHLIGESRDGVFLIPDIPYLEANYNNGNGASLAHMINLDGSSVFNSVDVSIQNMTIDMRDQRVMGEPQTYKMAGHGIRVGKGWRAGQFTVNEVTLRNVSGYGVGIQDRGGHPKSNVTLTNLHLERIGGDGMDLKEGSGDGNRNLTIRNVSIKEVGFIDDGTSPGMDLRYRDGVIENVNFVTQRRSSSNQGINFRPFDSSTGPGSGITGFVVSNIYVRGGTAGIFLDSNSSNPHQNVAISDFKIHGQTGDGVRVRGTDHTDHTISDGFVDPAFGGAAVNVDTPEATVTNVQAARWDPALTPTTDTTYEDHVSLAGETYSPAWVGIVGSEKVSLNPTSPVAGPFVFDVGNSGVMQIDFDGDFGAMDKLIVEGSLQLDGELRINMIGGTSPTGGTFQIFEAPAITGSFDTITLPSAPPGLTWVTDDLTTNGTISLLQNSNSFFFVSLAPSDGAINVAPDANLVVSFNKEVVAGTGLITLKNLTDSTQSTIDVNDTTQISISGNTLTINPASDLLNSKDYAVQITSGAIADTNSNAFAGIADDTTWNFTTVLDTTAEIDIPLIDTPPTIDGTVNTAEWAEAASFEMKWPELGALPNIGGLKYAAPTHADLSATVYYAWDAEYLYFGIDVTDDVFFGPTGAGYPDDHVLWGLNPSSTNTVWDNTYSAELGVDDGNVAYQDVLKSGLGSITTTASTFAGSTTAGGWSYEVAFAWTDLMNDGSFVPAISNSFGTHILLIDNDGSGRETFLYSAGSGNQNVATLPALWHELILVDRPPRIFSTWISDFELGALAGIADDPDGDRIPNGLEAWYGTHPGELSQGMAFLAVDGSTTTFNHPQSKNPPADLSLIYQWSTNLVGWYAGDGLDGPPGGPTVSVTTETVDTNTTVTVNSSEPLGRLFLRTGVQEN